MTFTNFPEKLWMVGGSVRDMLWERKPKDIDLASSLLPQDVLTWAKSQGIRAELTNEAHLVVTLKLPTGEIYEHTTFRSESDCDGVNAKCSPVRSLQEDLQRRDFTVNALAHPFGEVFSEKKVVGPNGLPWKKDIEQGVLRIVESERYGSARQRLEQSANRFFRGARFACSLRPHPSTFVAMREFGPRVLDFGNIESFSVEWGKSNYSPLYLEHLWLWNFLPVPSLNPGVPFSKRDRYPWYTLYSEFFEGRMSPKDFCSYFKLSRSNRTQVSEIARAKNLASSLEWHLENFRSIPKEELSEFWDGPTIRNDLRTLGSFFQEFPSLSPDKVKTKYHEYLISKFNQPKA